MIYTRVILIEKHPFWIEIRIPCSPFDFSVHKVIEASDDSGGDYYRIVGTGNFIPKSMCVRIKKKSKQ